MIYALQRPTPAAPTFQVQSLSVVYSKSKSINGYRPEPCLDTGNTLTDMPKAVLYLSLSLPQSSEGDGQDQHRKTPGHDHLQQ